jgi:hypothetical protein
MLSDDLGQTGWVILNGFDGTNTCLKVALGLVQVEKFTRITADIMELELEKELGDKSAAKNKIRLQRKAITVILCLILLTTIFCDIYLWILIVENEK